MGFMAEQESNAAYYGGGGMTGGFGGIFAMIILVVVVLWLLFRDGHKDGFDGHRDGFGGFPGMWGSCGPCVQPTFKDESNFEEERNINSKLCKIEMEQQACCCKELEATHCEGEKTRALIEQNYIQDLRDRLTEKNSEVMMLKSEMFSEKKFDQVMAAIGRTDREIDKLSCEVPKRQPVWAECVTPCTRDLDRDFGERFPRRGRCEECFA